MSVSGIGNTAAGASTQSTTGAASAAASQVLGQDAFLKLLMAELQNQDPTKPMDDSAFITQMATFTTVDKLGSIDTGIKDMNKSITALTDLIGSTNAAANGGQS